MARIIVLDDLSQDGLKLLESAGNLEVVVKTGLKGEELRKTLMEFDGAICRSGVKITAEAMEGNTRLRAIARAGVGVDNIDVKAATRHGIVVMNTPGGNTLSTAEQTLALMFGMSRNIAPAYQSLIEGRWDRKKFMGTQLAGKTLGIIGLGRIGQAVATRARALEMRILGYDPFLPAARAKELGIETVQSAREMLPSVDYLTVHTPLNNETKNLISHKEIAMMKKGARLINCARGGIFDEAALVEGPEKRPNRRRCLGRVSRRTLYEKPAVWNARRPVHAASGRKHRRGANQRGRRGRRIAHRLFRHRGHQAVGQHVDARSQDLDRIEGLFERGLAIRIAPLASRPQPAEHLPLKLQRRSRP